MSLDWNEARRGRDSRLAASSWLFRDKGLHFCLLAGLSRISSSSPTPKLNYRERRLITDRRSEGRVGSQLSIFPYCSMTLLYTLFILIFGSAVVPGADLRAALSILSILFSFNYYRDKGWPQISSSGGSIAVLLEKGQATSGKRLSIMSLLFWFHNRVCIYCQPAWDCLCVCVWVSEYIIMPNRGREGKG